MITHLLQFIQFVLMVLGVRSIFNMIDQTGNKKIILGKRIFQVIVTIAFIIYCMK